MHEICGKIILVRSTKKVLLLLALMHCCCIISFAQSTTWTGNISTDWSTAGNWTSGVPTESINAIIGSTTRKTIINNSSNCKAITLSGSAILTLNKALTATGSITINSGAQVIHNAANLITDGDFINNGTYNATSTFSKLTFAGSNQLLSGNSTSFRKLVINAGSYITLRTNISVSDSIISYGTFDPGDTTTYSVTGAANVVLGNSGIAKVNAADIATNYNITGIIIIKGGSTIEFSSNVRNQTIFPYITYSTIKISGNKTKTLTGNLSMNSSVAGAANIYVTEGTLDLDVYTANSSTFGGGTFSVSNGANLKIGSTNTLPTGYSDYVFSLTSNVEYDGNNQTVAAQTYGNLLLNSQAGTSTKISAATAFTIAGNLTLSTGLGTGTVFTPAAGLTVSGITSIGSGTTFNGGSYSHTINGNWDNAGTFNGNTSTITMNGPGTVISGAGTQNFNNLTVTASNIAASSATLSLAGNLASTGSGTFTHNTGGTLTMTGATKTISGLGLTLDNLSIATGANVTNSSTLTIKGNIAVAGTLASSAGAVTMTGTSKTISGVGSLGFYGLIIQGTVTTAINYSISNALDIKGTFTASAGTTTFTSSSTLNGTANLYNVTVNATSLLLSTNSVLGISNIFVITSGSLNVTTAIPNTVNYNGSGAQTILSTTYNRLLLSNGSVKSAGGAITTNGDFTINSGTTFSASTYTHLLYSNFVNNGTFTAGTGTMSFTGVEDVYITGATTFNGLTINKTASVNNVSLLSNITCSLATMTTGKIKTGTNTLTITSNRTGNGIILGNIKRQHTFITGVPYAFEGPNNTITFSSVSSVTSITVAVVPTSISDFPYGASINRQYTITVPSGTYNATLRLHYEDVELNGNAESSMTMWNYNGSAWVGLGKSANDATANYVELSGVTNITNRWTCGNVQSVLRWNGSVSSAWNNASNWTVIAGGNAIPASTDVAQIGQAVFTNNPVISTTVSVKNIEFGSVKAATLTLAAGGSLNTVGNISGTWTSNATHTIVAGAQTLTVNGNLVLSDGTAGHVINLTATTAAITIGGSLIETGSAAITVTAAGTINIAGDYNYTSGTFAAGTCTVNYNGTSAQDVGAVTYYNLTVNKSSGIALLSGIVNVLNTLTLTAGETDVNADLNVTGNLIISAGADIRLSAITLTIQGDLNNSGNFIPGASTITFNGTSAQLISLATFNNIIINKATGTITFTGSINVYGDFSILAGQIALGTYSANRTSMGGTFTLAAGAGLSIAGANNFPSNYTTYNVNVTSTVTYNGTVVQSVNGISYGNLVFSNGTTNAKNLAGVTTVNGDMTINSGATMSAGVYTINLQGNWVNSGTFTPGTGAVLLNGSAKTITGTTTFNKVTVYGSYTVAGSNTTYNSSIYITTGATYNAGSGVATVNGDLTNNGTLTSTGTTTFSGTVVQTIRLVNALSSTSSGIVNFNGTISPILNSSSTPTFATLNINNTGGINPSVNWTVFVAFNIASGAKFNGGVSSHTFYGSFVNNGTFTSAGTIIFLPSGSLSVSARSYTFAGTSFTSTGTIVFGGTGAVTIAGTPAGLNNIIVSNTAGVTPAANWTMTGDFSINYGAVFNAGTYTYNVAGDIFSSGTLNGGTSTFNLNAATTSEISGNINTTFYNLIVADSLTINSDFNVSHDFTNNKYVDASIGTVVMTGNLPSVIGGTSTLYTIATLSIQKSSGATATLAHNLTGVAELRVYSGTFFTSTYSITQATTGTNLLGVSDSATLKIGGTNSLPAFTTYYLDPLSTVDYAGTTQAISSAATYGNLTISTTGTKTASAVIKVVTDFYLANGTFVPGSYVDTLGGNWSMVSGAFTNTGNTIYFNGADTQRISSTGAFNNVSINKPTGFTLLSVDANIKTLTFIAGNLNTGSFKAIIPAGGSVVGAGQSTGWVNGKLQKNFATGASNKTFEVGDATNYTPTTLVFPNVTTAGDLTVSSAAGDHSNLASSTISSTKTANRTWTLTNSGISFTNYGATFTFVPGDLDGTANTANFIAGRYSAGWTYPTVGTKTLVSTEATGITAFGDFQLGETCTAPAAPTVTTPVNYCQNATATQLTATGSNLIWSNGPTTSGSVGGNASLTAVTFIDGQYGPSTAYTAFTTFNPNVTITSIDYTIPAYQAVTGLVISIYNSSNTLIASSAAQTQNNNTASPVTIVKTFTYTIASAGNYTIRASAGYGNIGGDNPSYPLTETTGTISITGNLGGGYRSFNNIQFTVNNGATAPTPLTTSTGTTNFLVSQVVGGCTSPQSTIAVVVYGAPTTAAAGIDQAGATTCGLTTVTLAGNTPAVGTGTWTIVSGTGGSFSLASSPTSTFSGIAGSTYTLRWTIASGPCTTSADDVVITFNRNPTTAAAGADQTGATTCGLTTVTLAGNTPSVGTGTWTVVSGTGGSFGSASSATSSFSGTAGTTYTLRWTISTGSCTPSTDDVIITFNRNPTTAAAGPDQTGSATCGLTTVTLAANTPAVGTGTWTIVSGTGGSFSSTSSASSTFTGTAATTYTLRWTIANSPCTSSTDDVVITFNQTPTTANAGPDQTGSATCGLTSVTLAGNTPTFGTGTWTIVSGTGGSFSSATSATSTFSGTAGTTFTLRWTIANSPCTSSADDVVITFNRNPTTANAGPDQTGATTCGLTTITLAGNTPNVGTGTWTVVSGTGGSFGSASSATSSFSGTAGTTYTLRWTIANSPCTSSTDDVEITFNQNPTTSNAGLDQTSAATCGLTSVTLAGNTPTVGTGTWTIVSGTGGSFSSTSSASSTFTGTAATTYTLRWTIANSPCTSSTDDVVITFNQTPTTANAGPDQTGSATCGLTSVTLAGNTPTVGTGTWTIVSGTGGSFSSATSPTSTFSGTAGSTYTLRWTIANSPCTSSADDVVITFNQNSGSATITYSGNPFCKSLAAAQSVSLTGVTGGTYTASPAGLTINASTGAVTPGTSTAGSYTVTYTLVNGPCTTTATASVTITAIPSATISYPGNPFCTSSGTATVTQTGTTGGTYTASSGGLSINATTGAVNLGASTGGTYTVTYTVAASAGCSVYSTTTSITVTTQPFVTGTFPGNPYCTNYGLAYPVGSKAGADGVLSSTAGLTINSSTGVVNLGTSTPGTYTITYAVAASGGCAYYSLDYTLVIIASPSATITYPAASFCANAGLIAVTQTGTAGGVYSSAAGLSINASSGEINANASTPGNYTVTYRIAASGSCAAFTTTKAVSITAIPSATISYAASPYCSTGGTATVTRTGTAGGTYSSTAGLTISASTGDITLSSSTAGSYTVTYTVAASGGCAMFSTTTIVTVSAPSAATINYSGSPYCSNAGTATVTRTGTTGGFYSSTAGLSINASSGDITLASSTAGTYTITYTMVNGGCTTTATTSLTITALATATISYSGSPYCTSAGGGGVTFNGTSGGSFSSLPAGLSLDATTGTVTPATSTAGSYTVTYTMAATGGCSSQTATATVTITTLPSAAISYTGTPFCKSLATAQSVSHTGTTGGTYTASPAGLSIDASTGAITPSASTAGTYAVTYTISAAGGCAAQTATASITITEIPAAAIAYSGAPFCKSVAAAQAVTQTGTAGGTYTASPAGLAIDASTGAITPSASTADSYTVTYTMAATGGCSAQTATASVTITTLPAATISYTGTPFCKSLGTAQAVNQSGTTGGTYTASPAGLVLDASTGAITPGTSTAGSYTVTYTLAATGGCSAQTATATVTITTLPAATISYSTPFCKSLATAQAVNQSGTTGGTYTVSPGGLSINASTGAVTPSTSTAGTYTVTYTMAAGGGCTAQTATASVTVTTLPAATISYSGAPFCKTVSTARTVTRTGTTGGTYTASPGGLSISSSTGSITPSASTAGTYTVTYTMAANGGCTAQTATVSVTITTLPAATITYSGTPFCKSVASAQSVTRTGTSGGTYTASPTGLSFNGSTGAITPSASTAGTYTVTYTIAASGGCSAVTATTTVTITAAPAATIAYSSSTLCSNEGTAAVTRTGTAGGVYSSTTGLQLSASTGAINLATSTPASYTVTYTVAASGGCAQFQTTTSLTILTAGIWTGAISTDWNNTANWLCGGVPVNTTDVVISSGLTNYPSITTGTLAVHDLTLQTGSTLLVSAGTLQVSGSIANSGTFTATNGSIEMNGTSAQVVPLNVFAGNLIKDLLINNAAGVTLGGTLSLTGALTIINGQFNTANVLTLKSSATGTARVARITSNAVNPIIGNVTVERYVPGRRKYRLITSSVTTSTNATLIAGQESQSIWGNWQNSGLNTVSNTGTFITGGTVIAGFDRQTTNASLYTYNDTTAQLIAFSSANGKNTKYTPLKAGVPYFMFVYGDRKNTVTTNSPNPTVLRATGTLLTGDQTYNFNSVNPLTNVNGRYTFLGNPFASPVDWTTMPKTNLENTYWGFDPNLSVTGGFVTVSTLGTQTLISPRAGNIGINQYIQSGQGFFVRTLGSSPSLTIREQDKVSNFNSTAFRGTGGSLPLLAVNLLYTSGATKILTDGTLAAFDPAFSNEYGNEDAIKMMNSGEVISIANGPQSLSIDARKMPAETDTLFLNVLRLTKPQYTLQIFTEEMALSNVVPYLQDNYLNTSVPLSLTDTNRIVFDVVKSQPASSAVNRFRIVFKSSGILPVNFTSVAALRKESDAQVKWSVASQSGIKKYEVERSANGLSFAKEGEVKANSTTGNATYDWLDTRPLAGVNYYRIRAIQHDGTYLLSKVVMVKIAVAAPSIKVFPNPLSGSTFNLQLNELEKGKYTIVLMNAKGQQVLNQVIDHPGGSVVKVVQLRQALPAGVYFLRVLNTVAQYQQEIFIE